MNTRSSLHNFEAIVTPEIHSVIQVFRLVVGSTYDRHNQVTLTMVAHREPANQSPFSRAVEGISRLLGKGEAPVAPEVSISSSDVGRVDQLLVGISSGVRGEVLLAMFHSDPDIGLFGLKAGAKAEAYARGAFLGLALSANPSAVNREEPLNASRVRTVQPTSAPDLQQVYAVLRSGIIHGRQVLPNPNEIHGVAASLSAVLEKTPSGSSGAAPEKFCITIAKGPFKGAEIAVDVRRGQLSIQTFAKDGSKESGCSRQFETIPSLVAAALGTRDALVLMLAQKLGRS